MFRGVRKKCFKEASNHIIIFLKIVKDVINTTEKRSVLHVALRGKEQNIIVDGRNVVEDA